MNSVIPLNVFTQYMPHLSENEGIASSCIYTARETHPAPNQTCMFKLPMRRGITWTHFKIAWLSRAVKPRIGFIYRDEVLDVELPVDNDYVPSTYTPLTWAIPSTVLHENAGFYLAIHLPADTAASDALQIEFVGFEQLLPADYVNGYSFTMNGQHKFSLLYDNAARHFYMMNVLHENHNRHNQYVVRTSAELLNRPV